MIEELKGFDPNVVKALAVKVLKKDFNVKDLDGITE